MSQDDPAVPPGLRDNYLHSTRDRLGEIAELAERLVASRDDTAAMDELRRAAHKIRGSAGSFGFAQASAVAGELEDAAKGWMTLRADPPGPAARSLVRRLAAAFFTAPPTSAASSEGAASNAGRRPAAAGLGVPEVIVVEDDAALAELLLFGLEARGYRCVHHRNGREALDALRALETCGTVPLVLLDVDLPALDGYSVFQALSRDCPGKFRVVFTTVHGNEAEQLRGLEGGALDYLVKPMSLGVALEKIRRWVGR